MKARALILLVVLVLCVVGAVVVVRAVDRITTKAIETMKGGE